MRLLLVALLLGAAGLAPAQAPVYSVRDLNAVTGQAMLQAVADGQRAQRRERASAALRALGPIVITGTVSPRGSILEYETPDARARWNVYLDFANEADEASVNRRARQEVAVLCRLTGVKVFVNTQGCRPLPPGQSVTPRQLPLPPNALIRKPVPPEELIAAPGQGLPANQLDGVYLRTAITTGVGGAIMMTYRPFLLLKDGSFYDTPHHAPAAFAWRASREREPQEWGQLTWLAKNKARLVRDASASEDGDRTDDLTGIFKMMPAPPDQRLSGRFTHTSGGGNTAIGGNTSLISQRAFTFTPDGRFQQDGFAGGGSGGDFVTSTPTVTIRSQAASQRGTYRLDQYSLTLTYESGQVSRLLFAAQDAQFGLLTIGDTLYISRK